MEKLKLNHDAKNYTLAANAHDEASSTVLTSRGAALVVSKRPTQTPGPTDILIEVHSIALNPVDHIQRKTFCSKFIL